MYNIILQVGLNFNQVEESRLFWFGLFLAVFWVIKFSSDKIAIRIYPSIATVMVHGKIITGPVQAFRYVFKYKLNGFLNKNIYGILGSILFAVVTVLIEDSWYYGASMFIIFILAIHIIYAVRVYRMSKN